MGLGLKVIHLAIELYKNNYFKEYESVIDMGDQDLHISFDELSNELSFIDKDTFEKKFKSAKNFPERPRVSSSILWNTLGFKKCSRLDIEKIERDKNDICSEFLRVDLNFPLEKQTKFEKYDLVTDLGNNEHPFNVVESYISMHKLCNKSGLMLIHQNIFGGNGFFNFDISFFESMAAANNYSILYSCYTVDKKNEYFSFPLSDDLLSTINLNIIRDIGVFYLFKKNDDNEFVMPYQGLGKKESKNKFFTNLISRNNLMPSRNYLPMSYEDISFKHLLLILIKKIIK